MSEEGAKSYQVSQTYEVEGDSIKSKNNNCPKCGQGYRMAQHNNRKTCGKCGYTEFQ